MPKSLGTGTLGALDLEDYLVNSLNFYERLANKAGNCKSFAAAVQARSKADLLKRELESLRASKQPVPIYSSIDEHEAAILENVQAQRRAAEAAGSFIAAQKYSQIELELLNRRRMLEQPDGPELSPLEIRELEAKLAAITEPQAPKVKDL